MCVTRHKCVQCTWCMMEISIFQVRGPRVSLIVPKLCEAGRWGWTSTEETIYHVYPQGWDHSHKSVCLFNISEVWYLLFTVSFIVEAQCAMMYKIKKWSMIEQSKIRHKQLIRNISQPIVDKRPVIRLW